jgi:thiamine-monophosphate kinase
MPMKTYPSSEYRLLESLKPYLNFTPDSRYPFGIGDDAVVRRGRAGERVILTADTCVENVHFSLDYMRLDEVGYKAMVTNVSDCAAMAARPESALVQVVFPAGKKGVDAAIRLLYRGIQRACKRWNFAVVGGDLSAGPCWMVAITLLGRVDAKGAVLRRRGARLGDRLWVTGRPGSSAAGLAALRRWPRSLIPAAYRRLVCAHCAPQARIDCGLTLGLCPQVHAMIDVSDGIAKESRTLSYDNRLRIELDTGNSIATPAMKRLSAVVRVAWQDWFLHGGEDYELLFAAADGFDPRTLELGVPFHPIGRFTRGEMGVFRNRGDGLWAEIGPGGYDHLSGSDDTPLKLE